jgi:hypothetical protein
MSAKISAAKRAAFLEALEATGNQTLADERAKVSRSWVVLHRSRDPEFDAAVRGACLGFARRRQTGAEPAAGWGFLDGEELVVRGTGGSGGGKRVQIARARIRGWSPRVEDRFLATLAATCNVKAACAEVGLSATSAYEHRKRWPAFAARWDAAVAEGYARIEIALLENGANLFSSPDLPDAANGVGPVSAEQAIHLLHMHKHQVLGIGKAPGKRWRRPRTLDEMRGSIMRKIEAIRNAEHLGEADKARDREEYARRRGGQGRVSSSR